MFCTFKRGCVKSSLSDNPDPNGLIIKASLSNKVKMIPSIT